MRIAIFIPNIKNVCGRSTIGKTLIKTLASDGNSVFVITNPESDLSICSKLNVKTLVIPCNPSDKSLISLTKCLLSIQQFSRINQIQIINAHHRWAETIALIARMLFKLKIKVVTTVHSYTTDHKLVSYRADKLVAVSEFIRDHLINYYSRKSANVELVYNGVKKLDQTSAVTEVYAKKIILGFGRLEYEKGFDILICALNVLRNELKNYELIIVGDGDEKKRLNELAVFYGINMRMYHSNSTPWEWIERASIVVIPSRMESLGLVVLEAGSARKCVIASSVGGIREIIKHNQSGLLFERENFSQLAELLKIVINNGNLAFRFGEALKNNVKEKFLAEKMTKNYTNLFNHLLNS